MSVSACSEQHGTARPLPMRLVALLRGVNVGGRQRVEMARLRERVGALGYRDVKTHLQSGNVIFSAPGVSPADAGRAIEGQLMRDLGLSVPVLVRTRDELAGVLRASPLGDIATNPSRYFVVFLATVPERRLLDDLAPDAFAPDTFRVGAREIYLWCPDGLRATKLTHAFWEKRLQTTATARNWNTVSRLCALADE